MSKLETVLKYGGAAAVIGVSGFFATFIVQGLIGLGALLLGGAILLYGVPVASTWLAQMKVKGMKAVAAANPIEELQVQRIEMVKAIQTASDRIKELYSATMQFKAKVIEFEKKMPDQAEIFKEQYHTMVKVYNFQNNKIREATVKLEEFDVVIERAKSIHEMTLAANAAKKAMKGFVELDPMVEIRRQTALESIQNSMYTVIADMNMSLEITPENINEISAEEVKQIQNMPTETADFVNVNSLIKDKV